MKYLFAALAVAVALTALDYYVYRNWRSFVRYRRWRVRFILPIYRVLIFVMPLSLPAYILLFRWWEVEPKLLRAAFVGFWAVYYVPKIPIALVLLLKDAARLITRQFGWLKRQRATEGDASERRGKTTPDVTDLRHMTRGEFLRRMGWTAASIPFAVVGFGVLRSLYHFQVYERTIRLPHLPRALEGIRIGQISDLHAGSLFSNDPLREAIDLLNAQRPDLLTFTGDFVNHDAAELRDTLSHLRTLNAELGSFACLGNHDHYARVGEVANAVGTTPFTLLVNEHRALHVNGARIFVVGTDNTGFNQHYADLPRATQGIPERDDEDLRLLLAHDPSFWDHVRLQRPDIDLTLSGHTHGGQVGFEFGPLRWSLARLAYARWAGLYGEGRPDGTAHYLYVNRGLGTVGPPVRLGVRPEITILTLVRA